MNIAIGPGHNQPPSLAEEIAARHAGLLADIEDIIATDLPMVVASDDAAAQVSAVGRDATNLVAKVTASHKAEKEPHLTAGRDVDAWKTATLAKLDAFLSDCKALVGAWQDRKSAKERERRDAEARRLAAEAEAAAQRAMASMTQPAIDRAAEVSEAAASAARAASAPVAELARVTAGGKAVASRNTKWTYEVTALADVPREYLTVNDAMVKAAIAGGKRDVPGLRIYATHSTSFR